MCCPARSHTHDEHPGRSQFYQQPGGEDQVFADEVAMLRTRGNHVTVFNVHNDEVTNLGKLKLAQDVLERRFISADRRHLPAGADPGRTFSQHVPAGVASGVLRGARQRGAGRADAAQLPAALSGRHVLPRWQASAKSAWVEPSRGRRWCMGAIATAGPPARLRPACSRITASSDTWRDAVDVYIALTEFSKRKFIQGGLPENKIAGEAELRLP